MENETFMCKNEVFSLFWNKKTNRLIKYFSENAREEALFEYNLYTKLSHPNILSTEEVHYDESSGIMSYAYETDLFNEVFRFGSLDDSLCRSIFLQIVSALKEIHNSGYVHGHLRIENVLLNGTVKLSGFSRVIHSSWDLDRPQDISIQKDIFALGVLLFTMRVGAFPFQEATSRDWWYQKILSKRYPLFWSAFDHQLSASFKEIVLALIAPKVLISSLEEIEKFNWVNQHDVLAQEEIIEQLSARHAKK